MSAAPAGGSGAAAAVRLVPLRDERADDLQERGLGRQDSKNREKYFQKPGREAAAHTLVLQLSISQSKMGQVVPNNSAQRSVKAFIGSKVASYCSDIQSGSGTTILEHF